MVLVVSVMAVVDHPRMLRRYRQQTMVLDSAITDEVALVGHLERLLGARVHTVLTQRVDLVNDTMIVDVRYELAGPARCGEETECTDRADRPGGPAVGEILRGDR